MKQLSEGIVKFMLKSWFGYLFNDVYVGDMPFVQRGKVSQDGFCCFV